DQLTPRHGLQSRQAEGFAPRHGYKQFSFVVQVGEVVSQVNQEDNGTLLVQSETPGVCDHLLRQEICSGQNQRQIRPAGAYQTKGLQQACDILVRLIAAHVQQVRFADAEAS